MTITLSDLNSFALKKGLSRDIDAFHAISLYLKSLEVPSKSNNTLSPPPVPPVLQEISFSEFKEPAGGEYSVEDLLNLFSNGDP